MKSETGAKSRQSTTPSSDTLKLPFRNSIHWQWKNVWSDQTSDVVVVLMQVTVIFIKHVNELKGEVN